MVHRETVKELPTQFLEAWAVAASELPAPLAHSALLSTAGCCLPPLLLSIVGVRLSNGGRHTVSASSQAARWLFSALELLVLVYGAFRSVSPTSSSVLVGGVSHARMLTDIGVMRWAKWAHIFRVILQTKFLIYQMKGF